MSIEMKIPENKNRVNANELGELIWWSAHLAVSPEKLLAVIARVGTAVQEIRSYLKGNK